MVCTLDPINYTITYKDGSTTISGLTPTSYNITSSTITLPTPTKDGYTFGGWFTASDLSGTAVTQIAKGSTGNKTFYAKWTHNTYDITYDLNGGNAISAGYTPVEYITGTGAQYINTGIVPQGNEVFDIDFTSKTAPSSFAILFGTREGAVVTGSKNAWLGFNSSQFYVRFGTAVPSGTIPAARNTPYKITVDLPQTKITINNKIMHLQVLLFLE